LVTLELDLQDAYYIRALIIDDIIEFPDGNEYTTVEARDELYTRIDDMLNFKRARGADDVWEQSW